MAESATILIPDISGYTDNELLEAILADHKLGLETIKTLCEKP